MEMRSRELRLCAWMSNLDTGDIIAKKQVRIAEDETGGSLFDKLAAVGAELCVETMQMLENKTATFTPQDNEASTHTKMISKELGDIDRKSRRWRLSA